MQGGRRFMSVSKAHTIDEDARLASAQLKGPRRKSFVDRAYAQWGHVFRDIFMVDVKLLSGFYIVVFPLKKFTACFQFLKNTILICRKLQSADVVIWPNGGPSFCHPNTTDRQPSIHPLFGQLFVSNGQLSIRTMNGTIGLIADTLSYNIFCFDQFIYRLISTLYPHTMIHCDVKADSLTFYFVHITILIKDKCLKRMNIFHCICFTI